MNAKSPRSPIAKAARVGALLVLGGVLAACESAPVRERAPEPPPVPPQRVFFYPERGQTADQQDRDRYECYNWAVRETGFDPSRRPLVRQQRQAVVPAPSGAAAVGGAVLGAVLGAAVAGPGHTGQGLVVGGVAGGMLGAASEQSAQNQAEEYNASVARRVDRQYGREMSDYRRAMGACLEGRGYSVK
ncbi:MAG: glycine zipper family protein [Steroidobacteraceae bacterium]